MSKDEVGNGNDARMELEEDEALATVANDAALGLTAWRTALRRELRTLWQKLEAGLPEGIAADVVGRDAIEGQSITAGCPYLSLKDVKTIFIKEAKTARKAERVVAGH